MSGDKRKRASATSPSHSTSSSTGASAAETGDAAELKADVHYRLVKSFAGDLATFDTKDRDVGVYIGWSDKHNLPTNTGVAAVFQRRGGCAAP